VFLEII